jgi:chromosome segregation ATPase
MVDEQLKNINEKLQKVLRKLTVLQKENERLNIEHRSLKQSNLEKTEMIEKLDVKINILQASKVEMLPEEKTQFEKRITGYIKQIDQYISMLSK